MQKKAKATTSSQGGQPVSQRTARWGSLSLPANIAWTFAGNAVYAASQWGLLIILAKLGSPEKVGQLALALAITVPVFLFSQLHLRAVQATDARNDFHFPDYRGLRMITTLLALAVTVGIVGLAGYRRETALTILLVGLARAFESMSDVYWGVHQQNERMSRIAKSMMLRGTLSLAVVTPVIWATGSVLWVAVGLALSGALIFLLYDRPGVASAPGWGLRASQDSAAPGSRSRPLRWRPAICLALFKLSLPLGLVMMLISLAANIPKYFVAGYHGEAALGIFAALYCLPATGNTVIGACGQAATPRLAKLYALGALTGFRVLVRRLLCLGALCGGLGVITVVVAGREILTLLYRSEYARDVDILLGLSFVALVSYLAQFLGYAMTAARQFRPQVPLFAIVAGATALACWIFVPVYGLAGAVLATAIAAVLQLIGSSAIVWWAISDRCPREETAGRIFSKPGESPIQAA